MFTTVVSLRPVSEPSSLGTEMPEGPTISVALARSRLIVRLAGVVCVLAIGGSVLAGRGLLVARIFGLALGGALCVWILIPLRRISRHDRPRVMFARDRVVIMSAQLMREPIIMNRDQILRVVSLSDEMAWPSGPAPAIERVPYLDPVRFATPELAIEFARPLRLVTLRGFLDQPTTALGLLAGLLTGCIGPAAIALLAKGRMPSRNRAEQGILLHVADPGAGPALLEWLHNNNW